MTVFLFRHEIIVIIFFIWNVFIFLKKLLYEKVSFYVSLVVWLYSWWFIGSCDCIFCTYLLQVVQIKYDLPHSELQNIALQAMAMLNGNPSLDAHALVSFFVSIWHHWMENTVESYVLIEEKFGYVWSFISFLTVYEMDHFWETVNCHKNWIEACPCLRQPGHKCLW